MRPRAWAVGVALIVTGCAAPPQATQDDAGKLAPTSDRSDGSDGSRGKPAPTSDRMSMEGRDADFRLYDTRPTAGESTKPTFWVHAGVWRLEEQDIWSFEKARAVIYGRDEEGAEITFDAGQGRFQKDKTAYLKDGVVAHIGKMTLQLTDIEWDNEQRVAQSDNPVMITSEGAQLEGATLRLYPDDKQLVMTDVSGKMRFDDALQAERKEP